MLLEEGLLGESGVWSGGIGSGVGTVEDGCLYGLIRVMLARALMSLRRITPLSRTSTISCGPVHLGASLSPFPLLTAGVVQQYKVVNSVCGRSVLLVVVLFLLVLSSLEVFLCGLLVLEERQGCFDSFVQCCLVVGILRLWTHGEFLFNQKCWLFSKRQEEGSLLGRAMSRCPVG